MSDVSKEFPAITAVLNHCDHRPDWLFLTRDGDMYMQSVGPKNHVLAAELRTLLARVPRAPERRLREVKGVDGFTYRWNNGVLEYTDRTAMGWFVVRMVDVRDLDAVMSLKADPDEAVETVEDVLQEAYTALGGSEIILPDFHEEIAARLRAARDAELAAAAAGGAR